MRNGMALRHMPTYFGQGIIQLALIVAALGAPVVVLAGAGELDSSFDGDGKATTTMGEIDPNKYLSDMVLQPDGKIVVAGPALTAGNADFALARFNSDGTLDTSFDGDGKVVTAIGAENDGAHGIALQTDGKLVVSGYTFSGADKFFALVRYNSDGSLDTGFDSDGKVVTSFPYATQDATGTRVAIQGDGKIVVTGASNTSLTNLLTVVRYNPDGSLDSTFDGDGIAQTNVGPVSIGNDIVLQSDGKIVVVGTSTDYPLSDAFVARYNPDGSLDTGFDGDGVAVASLGFSDRGYGVTVQPDGKIVACGYGVDGSSYGFAVLRYNDDGTPDTSFSGDGVVIATTSAFPATGVVIQADGAIAVGGSGNEIYSEGMTVVRLNPDGTLDGTFWSSGTQGKVFSFIGNFGNQMFALASQPDNRILLAGYASSDGGVTQDFAVARVLGGAPCGPVSAGCLSSSKAKLGINNDNVNASSEKDKLQWKWNGGPELTQGDFADPTGSTRYSFCLYQGTTNTLFATAAVDPGSGWAVSGTKGYKYKGLNADGLTKVGLKGGSAGKSQVLLKGKGVALPDFVFGMLEYPVTVQLKKQGSSLCFESAFTATHEIKNDLIKFKATY